MNTLLLIAAPALLNFAQSSAHGEPPVASPTEVRIERTARAGDRTPLADHLVSVAKEVCYAYGDSVSGVRLSATTLRWKAVPSHQTQQFALVQGNVLGVWLHSNELGKFVILHTKDNPPGSFACSITTKARSHDDYFAAKTAFRGHFNYSGYDQKKNSTDWTDFYGLVRPPSTRVIGSITYNIATHWLTVRMTLPGT